MKVHFLVVGKTTQGFVQAGLDEFCGRIKHYLPFAMEIIPEIKNTKNLSEVQQKEREGELILKALRPDDYLVLLDENGREYSSLQFASYLEKKAQSVGKRLVFVVGGPYGFSEKVYAAAAKEKISLSKMTFSHQLIRLIFVEQLYRALTILSGEPYHHQ